MFNRKCAVRRSFRCFLHATTSQMLKLISDQSNTDLTVTPSSFNWEGTFSGQLIKRTGIAGVHSFLGNRPGVVGAVLQTPLSLINLFIH